MNLSLTPDQMSAAASYLIREWGEYGYTIEAIECPTYKVALFRIRHSDGSRFTIATDKWGNSRDWESSDGEQDRVADMHRAASAA